MATSPTYKTVSGPRTIDQMRAELAHSDPKWASASYQEIVDGYKHTARGADGRTGRVKRDYQAEGIPAPGTGGNQPSTAAAMGDAARTPGANGTHAAHAGGKTPPATLADGTAPGWKPNGDGTYYTDDGLYFDSTGRVQDQRGTRGGPTTAPAARPPVAPPVIGSGATNAGTTKKGEASYGFSTAQDEGNGGDFAESDRANAAAGGHGYGQVDAPSPFGYNRDVFNAQHPSYAGGYYDPKTGQYTAHTEVGFQVAGPHGMETIGTGNGTAPPGVNAGPYLNPAGPVAIDPSAGGSTYAPGSSGNVPGTPIPGYAGGGGARLPAAEANPSWSIDTPTTSPTAGASNVTGTGAGAPGGGRPLPDDDSGGGPAATSDFTAPGSVGGLPHAPEAWNADQLDDARNLLADESPAGEGYMSGFGVQGQPLTNSDAPQWDNTAGTDAHMGIDMAGGASGQDGAVHDTMPDAAAQTDFASDGGQGFNPNDGDFQSPGGQGDQNPSNGQYGDSNAY